MSSGVSSRLTLAGFANEIVERDFVPDILIRREIRRLLAQRLDSEDCGDVSRNDERKRQFVAELKRGPIAIETAAANAQHYEVPARFFELILGKRLKYSSGLWTPDTRSLDVAEEQMLTLSVERADVAAGQRILELGCGWGSLSLYLAEQFPQNEIVGVSNSNSQRQFIEGRAAKKRLTNLTILTADMNRFQAPGTFDRIVSIEMFEHMRNYESLFARTARWMNHDGKMFVHIFTHARFAYPFEVRDASDWMAEHFFTGGVMPSRDLFAHFSHDVALTRQWEVSGTNYQKTAAAWLKNLDAHRDQILRMFASCYGPNEAVRWLVRWRIFLMACEELWGYRGGTEWGVTHYLFQKSESKLGA